jgi:hypothetical protein
MEFTTSFLDCPAYLDSDGTARCGLPAEVEDRYALASTDGPLECAKIHCPVGHWFNGPLESLAIPDRELTAPEPAWRTQQAASNWLGDPR